MRSIENTESLIAHQKHVLHGQPLSSDIVQLMQQLVSTQQRLRDALASNDRYRVAIDWLQHDFHLTFAAFRVQELMLQQQELQMVTATSQQIEPWSAPEAAEQSYKPLYAELQRRLHQHRIKLLGAGLYFHDRNLTQALEWTEADDLDARLFSLLASGEEADRGRLARAVTAEDVCMSTVLLSLAVSRARQQVQQLQDENTTLHTQLQQAVDDERWYARSELQHEQERYQQLSDDVQRCTSVIMAPFVGAVTAHWQQMPEVDQQASPPPQPAHNTKERCCSHSALCVCSVLQVAIACLRNADAG